MYGTYKLTNGKDWLMYVYGNLCMNYQQTNKVIMK